jgi:hypothetical protein
MSHFFAPFLSLLMSLGLIHMPPAEVRFPSIEWFAAQLQQANSADAAVAAAVVPAHAPAAPAVPVAKEAVSAVSVATTIQQAAATSSSTEEVAPAPAVRQPPASLSADFAIPQ